MEIDGQWTMMARSTTATATAQSTAGAGRGAGRVRNGNRFGGCGPVELGDGEGSCQARSGSGSGSGCGRGSFDVSGSAISGSGSHRSTTAPSSATITRASPTTLSSLSRRTGPQSGSSALISTSTVTDSKGSGPSTAREPSTGTTSRASFSLTRERERAPVQVVDELGLELAVRLRLEQEDSDWCRNRNRNRIRTKQDPILRPIPPFSNPIQSPSHPLQPVPQPVRPRPGTGTGHRLLARLFSDLRPKLQPAPALCSCPSKSESTSVNAHFQLDSQSPSHSNSNPNQTSTRCRIQARYPPPQTHADDHQKSSWNRLREEASLSGSSGSSSRFQSRSPSRSPSSRSRSGSGSSSGWEIVDNHQAEVGSGSQGQERGSMSKEYFSTGSHQSLQPPLLELNLPVYQPLSLSPFNPQDDHEQVFHPILPIRDNNLSRMIHPLPQRSRPSIDHIHYDLPEASRSAPDLCSPLASPNENPQWIWPPHDRCHSDRHHEAARLERRFQALLEIIDTETGYLRDLKLLEEIYLKKLDSAPFLKIEDKLIVRRNFAQVLELADRFGRRLGLAVGSKLDLWRNASSRDESEVDKLIERVAKAFISESPIFTVYEDFCARHTEAADVIRAFDSSPEWHALLHQPASPASETFISSPPSPLAQATTPTIRLTLQDFVIKPIQRIMRYPMLLNSLLKHMNGDINPSESRAKDKVYQALWAMKEVTEGVDEAKSLREVELKTELIASRMELHSSYRSAFICLLGQIKLVGSLHILYHGPALDPSEAFKIKYHGIFLYQTHIVIVKVKRATVYEPRHWFPIRYFDLVDIADSSGLMPYSFSLKYRQHTFEFGATCEQEKKCWVSKLRELKEEIENLRTMQILSDVPLGDDSIVSSIVLSEGGSSNQTHMAEGPVRSGSPVEEEVLCPTAEEPMVATTPSANQSRVSQRLSRNVNTLFGRTAEVAQAAIDLKLTEVFSEVLLCARLQEGGTEAGARARTLSATGTSTKRLSQVTIGRAGGERKLKRMSYMEPTTRTFEMVPPMPRVLNSSPEGSSSGSSLRRAHSGPTHVSGPAAAAPADAQLLDEASEDQHEGTLRATGVDGRQSREEPSQSQGSCMVEKEEERKTEDSATMRSTQSLGGSHWLPGLKMVRRLSRVGVRNHKKESDEGGGPERAGSEGNHQCKGTGTESKKGRMKRQTSTPLPSSAGVQQMSWRRGFMRKKQAVGGNSRDENGSSSSSEKENHRKAEEEERQTSSSTGRGAGAKSTAGTGAAAGSGAGGGIGSVFRSMMRLSPLGDSAPASE